VADNGIGEGGSGSTGARVPRVMLAAVGGCVLLAAALAVGIVVMIRYGLIPFLEIPAIAVIWLVTGTVGMLRGSVRGASAAAAAVTITTSVLILVGCLVVVGVIVDFGDPLLAGGAGIAVVAVVLLLIRLHGWIVQCRSLMGAR
jgi:hypothetical protein